jgi:hypothetical protein
MTTKKNMIGKTIRDINEAAVATETVNQANGEINKKLLAAMMSTSRAKPENADLLDMLGIKYEKISGATGWRLTGPNGRDISYRHATGKENHRMFGVDQATKRREKYDSRNWRSREERDYEDFMKIDFLDALTDPNKGKNVRRNMWGEKSNQTTWFKNGMVNVNDPLIDQDRKRRDFESEKQQAVDPRTTMYMYVPGDHGKQNHISFYLKDVDTLREGFAKALAEIDQQIAQRDLKMGEHSVKAAKIADDIKKRTGFEVKPGEAKRVVKATKTESAGFKHIKRKK